MWAWLPKKKPKLSRKILFFFYFWRFFQKCYKRVPRARETKTKHGCYGDKALTEGFDLENDTFNPFCAQKVRQTEEGPLRKAAVGGTRWERSCSVYRLLNKHQSASKTSNRPSSIQMACARSLHARFHTMPRLSAATEREQLSGVLLSSLVCAVWKLTIGLLRWRFSNLQKEEASTDGRGGDLPHSLENITSTPAKKCSF